MLHGVKIKNNFKPILLPTLSESENVMSNMLYIPIDYASTPHTGHVWVNHYWTVKDDCILFYDSLSSPQCNTNKLVSEHLLKNSPMYDGCTVMKISKVYKSSCSKFLRIERKLKH